MDIDIFELIFTNVHIQSKQGHLFFSKHIVWQQKDTWLLLSSSVVLAKVLRASRLFQDLTAQRSISPGIHYRTSQVCLSCQCVFIAQTIWMILLGPIS